jgi:O-antigen ligase
MGALFTAWSALTWLWSVDPEATIARSFTLVQLLAMSWLVWESSRSENEQRQLLHAYVAGAVVASVATILRYAEGRQTYWRRYAAGGFDPNDLGMTIAIAIPAALYLASRGRGLAPWISRAAIALICAAILLTASRTSLIAAVLALGFVVMNWRHSDAAQRVSAVSLLLLLVLGALWLAPTESRQRIATLPSELARGTLHNRTRIWKTGLTVLRDHPVGGVGAGAYAQAVKPWLGVPPRAGHEYVAHNTFLSVLVETGLAGFAIYAALLLFLSTFIWSMPITERALWATTLVVWATGVSVLTWEHRKPSWLIFALIMTAWARAFRNEPGSA